MRLWVTGGGGFLGRAICAGALQRGWSVVAPGRAELELRDRAAVRAFALGLARGDGAGGGPTVCVHAAAVGGGIGWMKEHPETAFLGNMYIGLHVIEACAEVGMPVVGVSSACVYPRDARQPMVEGDIWAGEPEPSNGPYGQAKRMMLVQGAAAAAERGLPCAFVVPTNLYGPHDHFLPDRSHIVAALIRRFEEARIAGAEEVVCWGSGQATRDLLYVEDAARGVLAAASLLPGPEPINLGTGVEWQTGEIAREVAAAVGYTGRVRWDAEKPDGMPRKVLDTARAASRLGWRAEIGLAEGLRRTVEWYRGV